LYNPSRRIKEGGK